jgi:hypothetical protein
MAAAKPLELGCEALVLHIVQDPTDPYANSARIGRILPQDMRFMWEELKIFLEGHPEWPTTVDSVDMILRKCAEGSWEPWVALARDGSIEVLGICTWELHEFERYYHIIYLAGTNLWRHFKAGLAECERYVYLNGGAEIILVGRPGWKRALRRFGYTSPKEYLSKNVRKTRGN